MSYSTVDLLATYLGIESVTDTALLQSCINGADAWIDNDTERRFMAETGTRYHDWRNVDGRRLWLDSDLCAITSVTNGDSVVVASSQYITRPRNATPWYVLELKSTATVAWDGTTGEIAIIGKWGYALEVPAAIMQASTRLAAWMYRQKDNMGDADRALLVTGGLVLPAQLPADVASLIAPYRTLVT